MGKVILEWDVIWYNVEEKVYYSNYHQLPSTIKEVHFATVELQEKYAILFCSIDVSPYLYPGNIRKRFVVFQDKHGFVAVLKDTAISNLLSDMKNRVIIQ